MYTCTPWKWPGDNLPDLNGLVPILTLLDVDVDGKVSIDISHLVLVALGHTRNQVINDRLDGAESGDILSRAVVNFDSDGLETFLGLLFGDGEGNCDVGEILGEFAYDTTCQRPDLAKYSLRSRWRFMGRLLGAARRSGPW